ncbi:MAG: hypothetical protein GYB64_00525, partial [Chloroflexi bacterium]|nr:hypothetical protein [Chloroflexota bacterium]
MQRVQTVTNQPAWRTGEGVFVGVALLAFMAPRFLLSGYFGVLPFDFLPVTRLGLIAYVSSAIALGLLALNMQQAVAAARRIPLVGALVALALLSAIWSLDPPTTVRSSIELLLTGLFGLYVAVRFRPAELVRILIGTAAAAAVLSLLAVVIEPELAIHTRVVTGSWRGIMQHKNHLGLMMGVGAVASWIALFSRDEQPVPPGVLWAALGLF